MTTETKHDFGPIARDVYSVKVFDGFTQDWCYQHMTTSLATARRLANNARIELRMSGRPDLVKIVHPRVKIVQAFLAFNGEFSKSTIGETK